MRVIDAFLFNNELDLLELRLMELDPVVNLFVLCEIGHNFRLGKKPLHFEQHRGRFAPWLGKIRHVTPAHYPLEPHPVLEHWQRNALAQGYEDAKDDDLILLGDVDEIPRSDQISALRQNPPETPVTFSMHLYYYWVNCLQAQAWAGTVALPGKFRNKSPQYVRSNRHGFPSRTGGWHFSWLGDAAKVAEKLRCIDVERDAKLYGSHEIVTPDPENAEFLAECIASGGDIFSRENEYAKKTFAPIVPGSMQPGCINAWLQKHPEYLWNPQ